MAEMRMDLPGEVDLSGFPGMISGSGERLADFLMQVTRDEQIASAAALNPGVTAHRITSTESIRRQKEMLCPRCRQPSLYTENGGCRACNGGEATVFAAPPQVTCPLCEGRSTVDAVVEERLIERPLGGEEEL